MRTTILTLLLAFLIAVPLWMPGRAASVHIEIGVHTHAGDVSLSNTPSLTSVSVSPAADASFTTLSDAGHPALPARVIQVALPSGRRFAGVAASAERTITLARDVRIETATPPAAGERPALAPAESDSEFPSGVVRYLGSGIWHGVTIASFAVFPVRVVDGDLLLHEDIRLTIDTVADAEPRAPRARRAGPARTLDIDRELRAAVVNDEILGSYPPIRSDEHRGPLQASAAPSLEGSPVDYVIVAPTALAATFDTLAVWKTAAGIPTVVRTVEWIEANYPRGTDRAETIRTFLKDAYANWGTHWVLLAGDTPEIPPRYLYSTYTYGGVALPSDLYFACLDGSFNADRDSYFGEQPADSPDLYAELCVGRLPASTSADAAIMISKILSYETPVDSEYVDKTLMLAEVLSPAPWSPPSPIYLNGADMAQYVHDLHVQDPSRRVSRLYETPGGYPGALPESRATAIDSLNAGYNFVFHIGHGYRFNMHCADDNVAIPDADALHHPGRYFNLFMLNCSAAAFQFDCFGEHLLRNPDGGAVSVIGAVNNAFAEISLSYLEKYAELVFDGSAPAHIGDAYTGARASRTPLAFEDGPDLWTHYVMTLLGDPAMTLWNGPAFDPVVTHPASLTAGVLPVTVTISVDGLPRAGAVVCLWKGVEDYQVAATNAFGQASFNFSAETAGDVRVVVTGRDFSRYEGVITVTPSSGPLLSLDTMTIDDDASGGTIGNGDGVINVGETIDLKPALRNSGGAPSATAVATLASGNSWATVLDDSATVGAIAGGGTATAPDAWRIHVNALAFDEAVASFSVSIVGGATWNDSFARVLHGPALDLTSVRASDATPIGDGNGVIAPGESFRLFVTVKNHGTGAATGLDASLTALGGGATVTTANVSLGDIASLAEVESAAGFVLSETSVAVENPLQLVVTDAYGRYSTWEIELRKPLPPAIQSLDASVGVDKMLVKWNGSGSSDAAGYRVYHATNPGGPFTRVTPDLIRHTLFTDTGLTPSTRYYFAVTTVDSSSNESAFSPLVSASTNPPQLAGWPNTLADPSANSPVVGDIDGNGDLEVVVGNNLLYAFNHDGGEVRDGDGQPVTWGVFSTLGEDFIGPAALAKLDGDMGLDIVAATYTSKQVFCFNGDGSVLPGWPRSTVDVVRAGVAVGDIDGDGGPEIVAVDQDAYLYAWHVDGSEVLDGDANPATHGVFRRLPDTAQMQYQMPALADIDDDGKEEVIIPTQDMRLYVLDELGANEPGWPRVLPNYAGGGVAVGDIDADGDLEIVVTVRSTGEVYALRRDNTELWVRWLNQNLFFNPSPALADLTGDGKLEVVLPSSNGKLYAITHTGANAPGWPVTYSTSSYTESSPVVADVTGDGSPDVLLGDEKTFINAWSSTGVPLDGFPLVTKDSVRGTPAVADLDGDGDVEIVAAGYDRSVYVWDLPGAYSEAASPWPMFHANVHRNGVYGYIVATGVDDVPAPAATLQLEQNRPNPFNPITSIGYEIPPGPTQRVSLVVYDVTGARVRTLAEGATRPGKYVVGWDGRNQAGEAVASGVYFYRLAAGDRALTRKMVLLK